MNATNRKKKGMATQLKDLDVSRVDGVDRPATGRKFLLFKSQDEVRRAGERVGLDLVEENTRIPGRHFKTSFGDLVFGVRKSQPPSDSARSYDVPDARQPKRVDSDAMNAEEDRFWSSMERINGKGTTHTPRPAWAVDSFLGPTGGHSQAPIHGYEMRGGSTSRPDGMNFASRGTVDGLAAPADFREPKPAVVRAGDGYVLKNQKGFWTSILGADATPSLEAIEKAMKRAPEAFSREEHAALAHRLAKAEGQHRDVPFPMARQHADPWLR